MIKINLEKIMKKIIELRMEKQKKHSCIKRAIVTNLTKDLVFLDADLKSEGIVNRNEFADIENTDNTSEESDDDVISLDDAALEEEQGSKN